MRPLALLILGFALCLAENNILEVQQTLDDGAKLPVSIPVSFDFQGKTFNFQLEKDEQRTDMLSESIFETAPHLPKGVFIDGETEKDFAFYQDGESTFVLHRPDAEKPCKMYGSFYNSGTRHVLVADADHDTQHTVQTEEMMREAQRDRAADLEYLYEQGHRTKRSTVTPGTTQIIELFLFADFSMFEYFSTGTNVFRKERIRDYMKSLTKDLDSLFDRMSRYSSVLLRVYLQQYQVAVKIKASPWLIGNVAAGTLDVGVANSQFAAYMGDLTANFFFPIPDVSIALTRYQLSNMNNFIVSTSGVCQNATGIATVAPPDTPLGGFNYLTNVAQAIAATFDVPIDGDGNACVPTDNYVMSGARTLPSIEQFNNPWTFSSCSITAFETAIAALAGDNCLLTQDFQFDWGNFSDNTLNYGKQYTIDEQCENSYALDSAQCTGLNATDMCWVGTSCLVNGTCQALPVGQGTICNEPSASTNMCDFNRCGSYPTSGTSTEQPLASSTVVPMSSTPITSCVIDVGETLFDVPCSCGCDAAPEQTCPQTNEDECPAGTDPAICDCCAGQVKVNVRYAPPDCDFDTGEVFKSNSTQVIKPPGANIEDVFATGYIYYDGDNWRVFF